MKRAKLSLLAWPLAAVLVLMYSSCADVTAPANQSNGRVSIVNDPAELAALVAYHDDSIPLDIGGVGYGAGTSNPSPGRSTQTTDPSFKLKLKAEVAPPSIGGQVLQATSVSIVGQLAVVSFNMAGSAYLGAVEVFDLSDKNKPALTSRALFQNTDVSAVFVSGRNVYAAEATGDAGFASPAVVEVMQLVGNKLVLSGNHRRPLSSFAGTSAVAADGNLYATSGDDGALFVIDPVSLLTIDSIKLHDARWVDVAGGKVVVVQGTPGRIAVFSESNMAPAGTWPFTGGDIAQSKSTVQVVGGKAFIAAGSGGVQVLSANTGLLLGSVPRPDPTSLGLAPSVVVTNSASVDDDLVFISNGEAGVYVAQGGQAFSTTSSETPQTITMRGRLRFGNLQSVNHVAYSLESGYLMIAAGLGGIKIVKVR
jgi:hypothetical protein